MADSPTPDDAPAMAIQTLMMILLAAVLGAAAAVAILPRWLPALAGSMGGEAPKAFWYLSRASGLVSYLAIWLSMLFGLLITNKWAKLWPGGPTAFDLHQHTGLLGLAVALFHGLILMGDRFIGYTLPQVLVPFASAAYEPLWVGLGQLALYGSAVVSLSFYVRRPLTQRRWRLLHYLSFLVYLMALLHGIQAGSDTAAAPVTLMYWLTGGALLFMSAYRLLATRLAPPPRPARVERAARRSPDRTQPPAV